MSFDVVVLLFFIFTYILPFTFIESIFIIFLFKDESVQVQKGVIHCDQGSNLQSKEAD